MYVCVCVCSYLRHLLFTPFIATPLGFGAMVNYTTSARTCELWKILRTIGKSFMVQIRHFALFLLLLPCRLEQLKFQWNSPIGNTPTKILKKKKKQKTSLNLGIFVSSAYLMHCRRSPLTAFCFRVCCCQWWGKVGRFKRVIQKLSVAGYFLFTTFYKQRTFFVFLFALRID